VQRVGTAVFRGRPFQENRGTYGVHRASRDQSGRRGGCCRARCARLHNLCWRPRQIV